MPSTVFLDCNTLLTGHSHDASGYYCLMLQSYTLNKYPGSHIAT